jgi:hypothetical protein
MVCNGEVVEGAGTRPGEAPLLRPASAATTAGNARRF